MEWIIHIKNLVLKDHGYVSGYSYPLLDQLRVVVDTTTHCLSEIASTGAPLTNID